MNLAHTHATLERYGAGAAVYDLIVRGANRVTEIDAVKVMRLDLRGLDPSFLDMPRGGVVWGFLDRATLLSSVQAVDLDLPADFVQDALAKGDLCYGARVGGMLVSYAWYSRQPTPMLAGMTMHFDPAYAYMYKAFTVPTLRGNRLLGKGVARALRALADASCSGLIAYVRSSNFASLRACHRVGYRVFGGIVLGRVGPWSFAHASAGCARFGVRAEQSRPARSPSA